MRRYLLSEMPGGLPREMLKAYSQLLVNTPSSLPDCLPGVQSGDGRHLNTR